MIITFPKSIFIDVWKLHFSCFWNAKLKNVIIRIGLRTFPGKFVRISWRDPIDVEHERVVALATTLHKIEHLPMDVRRRFQGMSKQAQVEAIQQYEKEIEPKLHDEIQVFVIEERKKGTSIRDIKRKVLKKFKVNII